MTTLAKVKKNSMSMFVKTLDVKFDDSNLDFIRESVLDFHSEHRQEILNKYDTGHTKHKPHWVIICLKTK
jgi:hypothetical protein